MLAEVLVLGRHVMSRWQTFLVIAVFGLFATSALPLLAQVGGIPNPYGPPPLSPWLNLYQKQGGPVDNYHMFVQPSLQLNNALNTQQADIQRNTAGLGTMSDRVMGEMEMMRAAPSQTGVGAGFMNHRVYFNTYRMTGVGGSEFGTTNRGNYGSSAMNAGNTRGVSGIGTQSGQNMGGFGGGMGSGFGGGMGSGY